MPLSNFTDLIEQASPATQAGWARISGDPCRLFHAISPKWRSKSIDANIEFLQLLESEQLLDVLLADYFLEICKPDPRATVGFTFARMAYHRAGYELRLPSFPFTIGPRFHTFEIAGMARLIEDGRFNPGNEEWTRFELERLRRAIDAWLEVQVNK